MKFSCSCSIVSDSFVTPWTVAHQAPLSMGFFRQKFWSGLPFPPPGDLHHPGIEPMSPSLALVGGYFYHWVTWEFSDLDCCCYVDSVVSDSARPHRWQPQAPPSLGFSRQEHWSGLPFPSPVPESEKWKWSCSVMSDSSRPHGLQPTRLLRPWDSPGKGTRVGCHVFSSDLDWNLPNPGPLILFPNMESGW